MRILCRLVVFRIVLWKIVRIGVCVWRGILIIRKLVVVIIRKRVLLKVMWIIIIRICFIVARILSFNLIIIIIIIIVVWCWGILVIYTVVTILIIIMIVRLVGLLCSRGSLVFRERFWRLWVLRGKSLKEGLIIIKIIIVILIKGLVFFWIEFLCK